MREGIHLVNVFVSPVVCRPLQSFGWRMPVGVHGKAGSTPVPGSLSKVDWGALVNDCRQRGACGECRRNYMALWAPVRLRAAAKNRSGLTGGQRCADSPPDRRRRCSCLDIGSRGRMLGGLHLDTIHVSTDLFVGLFQRFRERMPVGVHGTRPKTQAGSKPALVSATGSRKLSPILVEGIPNRVGSIKRCSSSTALDAKLLKKWSGRPGSNRRRPAWEMGNVLFSAI